MCNLSQGIEDKALEAGKAVGLAEGKTIGLAEGKTIGLAEGKTIGLAEGKTIGLAEGKTAAQIDIILNMYKNNFTVEQIALATQHKVDEVKEIIKNN